MGKVHVAPIYEEVTGPLIFLAGPIKSALRWQDEAINIIQSLDEGVSVANPRRGISDNKGKFTSEMKNEQIDWETFHLNRAAKDGVILFWLAKEDHHLCERAYAQTSRFELAEWKERHLSRGTKLVLGIEEGFSGAAYIQRRISQDCPDIKVCDKLEDVCREAVKLANTVPII